MFIKVFLLTVVITVVGLAIYFMPKDRSEDETQVTNVPTVEEKILEDIAQSEESCLGEKCSVDKIVGDIAKGSMPMAYWMAVNEEGKWKIVVSGNGIPSCEEIDKYSIPKEIYGNCIETSEELRF